MHTSHAPASTRFKVGLFTVLGLALIGAITVFVNDRPFWWRSCELVHISVEDATGLKMKSPVRSLGLQIGYLKSVELSETFVRLGICVTAPVEVLPTTRAYIRGEGFLGDKFVELKPVRYIGNLPEGGNSPTPVRKSDFNLESKPFFEKISSWLISNAYAEEAHASPPGGTPRRADREIPVGEKSQDVQQLVNQVDSLVNEMTNLTTNLKDAIDPQELKRTMNQLNRTLENASRTLSPEGGLNTTAQRTLAKLEDAIEQLRDLMTRVNKGEGSVGMLLNDPTYAEEIRQAIRNINKLLGKVGGMQFIVDFGAEQIPAYDGARGWFRLGIWPERDRYYLIGASVDPRGVQNVYKVTTVAGGQSTYTESTTVQPNTLVVTAMLGKVLWDRLDLSAGIMHNDGLVSFNILLGPTERESMIQLRNDVYARVQPGSSIDNRITLIARPLMGTKLFSSLYLRGGLESIRSVNGRTAFLFGGGLTFNDEDIKLLFSLM